MQPPYRVNTSAGTVSEKTLLLAIQVCLFRHDNMLYCESQACNGLRLWAENFDRVLVMSPTVEGPPPKGWQPVEMAIPDLGRIEFHPLPMAYRPDRFLRCIRPVRRQIAALILRANYLCFAIGGLFGDWGTVACLEATRLGRPYSIWTDRVESQVTRLAAHDRDRPFWNRLRAWLTAPVMAHFERRVIGQAQLGLFHGKETYEAFSRVCRGQPELVHDIHISRQDRIMPDALAAKRADAAQGPLRLCYTGRADYMKGPFDWLEVLQHLDRASVDFRAVWLGDGALRTEMLRRIEIAGLNDRVEMPGFTSDRQLVLETLRQAHLFLFCHKTPESPRCLIEALLSGTPIVGYDSAYPRDLITGHGGGQLTRRNDIEATAQTLIGLSRDRVELADLMGRAFLDGAPFNDEAVFRHRSNLIKTYL